MMHGVGWLNDQKPKETVFQGQVLPIKSISQIYRP